MLKKLQLFFLGLMAASCLMAQPSPKSVTISESNIQFWTGSGTNSTVVAIGWDDDDASYTPTVVVWGIHWNGTITLLDALDTLMAYDSHFSYSISGSFLTGVTYNDPNAGVSLTPSAGWNCNNYNGVYGSTNLGSTWLRISESTCDNYNFTGVNNLIYASNPNNSGNTTLPDTVDASLPFSDILFWVGTGTDSAEFIVNFAQPDTAFAWGYLFNSTTTAQAMVNAIAAADPRFWTEGSPSSGGDIFFLLDNGDTLSLSPVDPNVGWNFWWTNLNGVSAASGAASTLHNGDVFKYGDLNSATGWDMAWGYYMEEAWNTIPTPVPVPTTTPDVPEDASFAATDILYWVGTGSNEVVLAVNWADTALAWGYRFNGEKTVADMMSDIAAADPRFSFTTSGSMLSDINFNTGSSTLGIAAGNYWWSLLNHESGMGMIDDLEDGDFYKWGDLSVAVIADSTWVPDWGGYWDYTYVWPYTIHPVSVPTTTPDVPEDASFAATDILYWVGTGSNEVVLAVNWADTALAWGYRFNGEKTVADMMSDIAAADPRFSFTTSGSMLSDINFNTGSSTLGIAAGNYWWSLLNHESGMGMIDDLEDGDFFKWGDLSVAVIADSTWVPDWGGYWDYTYVWPYTIYPVSVPAPVVPVPDEATIDASAIEYWVGEGSNQVVMAVNWADTALAWGYRFNGDKTVADMMSDIAAADPRFSYTMNGGYLGDINFVTGNRTLSITPGNYWSSTNNGFMDMGMGQTLNNGDFEKWADPAAGVIVDSTYDEQYSYWWYTYVYPMTIYAAGQPEGMGPFCGIVGTEGCTAVKYDDSRIKAWATACTIVRGSQNLTNPDAPEVTYGDETQAVGPCTSNNMNVVSLGDGGYATLTFEKPIANGNGYDFAVFENSFDDYFLELAFVEVSSDGQRFVRFPATSLTQTARQIVSRVDATYINNLAGKFKTGFGTPFDLDELRDSTAVDINNITHVRIVDVVGSIDPQYATYDAFGHIVNDPFPTNSYSAGFDLDGIAVMNQKSEGIDDVASQNVIVFPNPVVNVMNITVNEEMTAQLFDMSGRCLMTVSLHNGNNSVSMEGLSNGVYLLRTPAGVQKIVKR